MFKKLKYYLNEIASLKYQIETLSKQLNEIRSLLETRDLKSQKINLGQIQSHLNNQKKNIYDLSEVEFQVFSQFGDDGIIQYLINKIDIPNKTFIEFGVENYMESNTRFLLYNNNWTGFVMDGSNDNVNFIKKDIPNWASELYVKAAFINAENINDLVQIPGFNNEVGILSIDIDGNDYWVWKAIDSINPIIVIIEYNSLFGKNNAWTIPYESSFVRGEKSSSLLYFGASLKALQILGERKGYSLIGSCSRGLNAYFIRNDKVGDFKVKSAEDCYVYSKFREVVIDGERVSGLDRVDLIKGLEVFDVLNEKISKIDKSLIQFQ